MFKFRKHRWLRKVRLASRLREACAGPGVRGAGSPTCRGCCRFYQWFGLNLPGPQPSHQHDGRRTLYITSQNRDSFDMTNSDADEKKKIAYYKKFFFKDCSYHHCDVTWLLRPVREEGDARGQRLEISGWLLAKGSRVSWRPPLSHHSLISSRCSGCHRSEDSWRSLQMRVSVCRLMTSQLLEWLQPRPMGQ